MPSPSYLIRNRYSYCFRLHVPADLQEYIGKKELRYSLRTGYLSEAKFKTRFYAAGVQLFFRRLKELVSMKFNDDQIKEFAKAYFEQQLQKLPSEFRPENKMTLECGIVAAKYKKTIHSFRHNVSSCLMEHDVQEYVIAMFMGHEHDQISTGRYGQKFEPDMLMERAVYKLDYGIDLSHLKKSKYVPK